MEAIRSEMSVETILIALACNDAYARAVALAIHSVVIHTKAPLSFLVLTPGLDRENQELIGRACGSNKVVFKVVSERQYAGFRTLRGSTTTYMRLKLPELVEADWVLYSDADVLWQADVAELWAERDDRYHAVAAEDCESSALFDDGVYHEYFCAGVMLVNLALWRRDCIASQCSAWLRDHPEAKFYDQSAINRVLKGKVKLVDKQWNRFVGESGDAKVLHYAGHLPWKLGLRSGCLDDAKLHWFRMLASFMRVGLWTALRQYNSIGRIVLSRLGYYLWERK